VRPSPACIHNPNNQLTPPLFSRTDPTKTKTYVITIPIFILLCSSAAYGIFNYQKASSSVVSSSLYSLRTHPRAREVLGDEIGFSQKFPIIHGELNQFHGNIDISYSVKGSRGNGIVRFKSSRKSRMGFVSSLSNYQFCKIWKGYLWADWDGLV
jgi:hypothetical protein